MFCEGFPRQQVSAAYEGAWFLGSFAELAQVADCGARQFRFCNSRIDVGSAELEVARDQRTARREHSCSAPQGLAGFDDVTSLDQRLNDLAVGARRKVGIPSPF